MVWHLGTIGILPEDRFSRVVVGQSTMYTGIDDFAYGFFFFSCNPVDQFLLNCFRILNHG